MAMWAETASVAFRLGAPGFEGHIGKCSGCFCPDGYGPQSPSWPFSALKPLGTKSRDQVSSLSCKGHLFHLYHLKCFVIILKLYIKKHFSLVSFKNMWSNYYHSPTDVTSFILNVKLY